MKAERITQKKAFEPIEIKLTIESEDELCNLWHRFNVNEYYVFRHSSHTVATKSAPPDTVWIVLNDLVSEKNLKR